MEIQQTGAQDSDNYLPIVEHCCQAPSLIGRIFVKAQINPSSVSKIFELHEMEAGMWIRQIGAIVVTEADQLSSPAIAPCAIDMIARKIQEMAYSHAR